MPIGGSMGGATVSRVGNEVPELIAHIVHVAAFCCVRLPNRAAYLSTPEGSTTMSGSLLSGLVGDPTVLGATRTNWRSAGPDFLATARSMLMAEATDAEFFAALNASQPDGTLDVPTAEARVEAGTWGRIPRGYIRHTEDRLIPIALQDRMIREADELTPATPSRCTRCAPATCPPARPGWRRSRC